MIPETDITETLDTCGLLCPLPVLKARKRLQGLPDGALIKMIADDPAARIDVPHFCTEQGHALVHQDETDGTFEFIIRKGG